MTAIFFIIDSTGLEDTTIANSGLSGNGEVSEARKGTLTRGE